MGRLIHGISAEDDVVSVDPAMLEGLNRINDYGNKSNEAKFSD